MTWRGREIQLFNIFVLMTMGLWGYADKNAPTALIPFFGGLILWIWLGRSGVFRLLRLLLLVVLFIGLVMPIRRSLHTGDALGMCRSALMATSTLAALLTLWWQRQR